MQPAEEPSRAAPGDALLARLVLSAHDAVVAMTTDLRVTVFNPAAEQLYGYPAEQIVGGTAEVLVPADRRPDEREFVSLLQAGGRLDRFRTQRLHRDGRLLDVSLTMSPMTDDNGAIVGVVSIGRTISDRERLEASLQALLEAGPDAVVGVAPNGRVVLANNKAEQLFDLPRHGLVGRPIEKLISAGLPDPGPAAEADGQAPPVVAQRSDGRNVPVELSVSLLDTDHGAVRCVFIRDITQRLQAQAEYDRMRAEADRGRLESQLQRAQRLESLGQLAGGVAHDFNNLIAVILSYAGFIVEEATEAGLDGLAHDAEQINRAGQRGSELTHQLLAFARREVVRPQILHVNQVVNEVEQLLRRSLGEHITLVTALGDDLPAVTVDPGQLEQVLVNLAVNARDAMPNGGQLTIETQLLDVDADYAVARPNLTPGRYVRTRVSDTGTGMPRHVVNRAFEPFFTTKPAGQGTGLGLATAYGIITGAGGDLHIYSEPGMGTTISIALPGTGQVPVQTHPAEPAVELAINGETILVVEDEPALREVIVRILTGAGYQVLVAPDGVAALEIDRGHGDHIHLLLTDVVMPQMLGKELAERLTANRPQTRVLYMSGYAQPVLASQGTLDPDVVLLEKPFTKAHLLAAVRSRIDRPPGPATRRPAAQATTNV